MKIDHAMREHFGLSAESWDAWIELLAVAFVCTLTREQRRRLEAFLRRPLPVKQVRELWIAAGRRAGKDYVATRVAAYLALFHTWALSPGEVGVVLLLAVDRAQVKVALSYLRGALEANPVLAAEIVNITADCITLRNGVEIQVGTSDFAAVRGRTLLAVICDEFAFWVAGQAIEVLRAIRPGMASQPRAMLIVISSVYSQSGPFYDAYKRYYGVDDPRVLFVLATTRELNPTIPQEFIDAEIERDPQAASAEYLSVFRSDLESFIDAALLDAVTRTTPREIPRLTDLRGGPVAYFPGLDVSGGRGDATAVVIGHRDLDKVVIDCVRYWLAPHDPLVVAGQVAEVLACYGLQSAVADQYGAEVVRSVYREAGVELIAAPVTRSEAFLHLLPLLTTARIEIPDEPRLRAELIALERRTGRSGKDSVDHPPHGHDDVANALALAAHAVSRTGGAAWGEAYTPRTRTFDGFIGGGSDRFIRG